MANVVWLGGRQADGDASRAVTSLSALRLITGLEADEFANAIGEHVGWPVPLFVYLQWEREEGKPPAEVLGAARQVAVDRPLGPELANESRRRFLGSVVGLSALAAAGFPMAAQPLGLGARRPAWRASPATASDLAALVESYRRSYAGRSAVASLLPGASGLLRVLADMAKHDQSPDPTAEVESLIGQAAVLTGLLNLMGPRDMVAAESHYELALQAALLEAISTHVPAASVVSEESSHDEADLDDEWCFVIDPIDGTEEFVAGQPGYAICVALLHHGRPHAAVLDLPAHDQRFDCSHGTGTRLNGNPSTSVRRHYCPKPASW